MKRKIKTSPIKQEINSEELDRRMRILANHLLDIIIENHQKSLMLNNNNFVKIKGDVR